MKLSLFKTAKVIVAVAVSIGTFEALSVMLFGSLGTTAESSNWDSIVLLYFFLATIGAIAAIAKIKSKFYILKAVSSLATFLSVTLSFALIGFYYGGSTSDNNPRIATITAIVLGIIGTIFGLRKNQVAVVASTTIATLAAYAFAFYAGTNATAYFSVSRLFGGMFWSIICLIYLLLTMANFTNILRQL